MDEFHDLVRSQALLSSACAPPPPSSINPSNPSPNPDKKYRCSTCGQSFSRAEHLKRHQTRHTGAKPFSCIFCDRDFSRKDRLQTHYNHCQRRGDRPLPNSIPKGRKPHACVTCISSKIRCDGKDPCAPCQKKNLQCVQKSSQRDSPSPEMMEFVDDRVSIKALLNGGVDTFTESFNLPPSDDRVRSLEHHHRKTNEQNESAVNSPPNESPDFIDYASMFESPLGADSQYFDFWTGPFGLNHSPSFNSNDPSLDLFSQGLASDIKVDQGSQGPELHQADQVQYVAALHLAMYNKLWSLALEAQTRHQLTNYLNFLLTTERITRFISMYFRNWHLNCPMIHRLTFDPAEAPLTLLLSVTFVGALYSKVPAERLAAQKLVDVAELVVFDSEIFSLDTEVSQVIETGTVPAVERGEYDWNLFRELQGGFLMVIAQYWGGARIAKSRAVQSRFSDVVKVLRKMRLPQSRHHPSDRISEVGWLQKESRIRTMAAIALLDCAMRIYSNHPCRMMVAELECDLPCKETTFNSEHPFMEDDNIFAPRLTISRAFSSLFQLRVKRRTSSIAVIPKEETTPTDEYINVGEAIEFTRFDLFIMIHFLYTYILSYVMTLSFSLPVASLKSTSGQTSSGKLRRGALTEEIREALGQWKFLWDQALVQAADQPHRLAGMFRNAFSFWLVAKSIINKEESIHVITTMEVNCDDALTKLKVLFQNDND